MPSRFALWFTIFIFAAAALLALGTTPARAEEEGFSYPLRAGESVTDVARIFRVPAEELIELNGIRDPNRLQLGQTLRIPNIFSREVAELRAAQQKLDGEKQAALRTAEERQKSLASLETQLRQTQSERDAVSRELALIGSWESAAKALFVMLFAAIAWAVKSHLESAMMARKQRVLHAENASLKIAKDKYRLAVSQLELRYQGLYGKRREPLSYAIAEGLDRLRRAFGEGAVEIERLLAQVRSEREQQYLLFEHTSRARAWLFHPLRELLGRDRLKYHAP